MQGSPMRKKKRIIPWVIAGVAVLLLLLIIAIPLLQEPLRQYFENNMNEKLVGYTARIGAISVNPFNMSVVIDDLLVFQDAHPEPPVAEIGRIHAGVHWREIFRAKLVADFDIDNPAVHLNLIQIREEIADPVPADEKGWQEALESLYPLRINVLTIRGGNLVYIDEDPDQPLVLNQISFEAENIRNIRSPETTYPSPFRLESLIFGEGRLLIEGDANFLAEPYPGVNAGVEVTGIPIDPLLPLLSRYNFFVSDGEFAATGRIEYAPHAKLYEFDSVVVDNLHLDYRYPGPASQVRREKMEKAAREGLEAKDPEDSEAFLYVINDMRVNGIIGLVNTEADPPYRVFLDPFELRVGRLSNRIDSGATRMELSGAFMGSGETAAAIVLEFTDNIPDFDLSLIIKETHMPAMNDLLMAYGGFDVSDGAFSLTLEVSVEDHEIQGFVEPFFKDMEVLDPDKNKDFLQTLYEGVVEALSSILENVPRDEVATRAFISGDLDDPDVSTWQIIGNLIRNAFFEAILPGFEGEAEME
jgi:hypothetical protein